MRLSSWLLNARCLTHAYAHTHGTVRRHLHGCTHRDILALHAADERRDQQRRQNRIFAHRLKGAPVQRHTRQIDHGAQHHHGALGALLLSHCFAKFLQRGRVERRNNRERAAARLGRRKEQHLTREHLGHTVAPLVPSATPCGPSSMVSDGIFKRGIAAKGVNEQEPKQRSNVRTVCPTYGPAMPCNKPT